MRLIPIKQYRDFWDVPRIFLVSNNDRLILFNCEFDEETGDYRDEYQVCLMPALSDDELAGSWIQLSEKVVEHLGEIAVSELKFDQTHRRFIEATTIVETFGL